MMSPNESEEFAEAVAAVQEGDYETVKEMVLSNSLHPNAVDSGNCTLLHWAAINNRCQIAHLLVDHGAEMNAGGILYETPLMWAVRKRYYAVAQLLVDKTHPDLKHKSRDGLDALHLAIRLQDVNGAYLLLCWGANPNSEDDDGLSPLLYLVKTQEPNATTVEMIRILLRFDADVTKTDREGEYGNLYHTQCMHTHTPYFH
ncbi:ankyrin repeat domain-containing protein [archaeon]|nr:MAG: ankyrin repeat domain-containing protein [archaeon]